MQGLCIQNFLQYPLTGIIRYSVQCFLNSSEFKTILIHNRTLYIMHIDNRKSSNYMYMETSHLPVKECTI